MNLLSLGPLAFANPWVLAALVLLPLLWWLLKVVPPAPRRVVFPAVRLLFGLETDRRAAESTPIWLILLRILLLTLLILAIAHPIFNPSVRTLTPGNMLIVVDDGWASSRDWSRRLQSARNLIAIADREDRLVSLHTTAPRNAGALSATDLLTPQDAERIINTLTPVPWPVDRQSSVQQIAGLDAIDQVFWIADGVAQDGDNAFIETLNRTGTVTVIRDMHDTPVVLMPPDLRDGTLEITAGRPDSGLERDIWVVAENSDNEFLARLRLEFLEGSRTATTVLDIPIELRNRITRFKVENEASASAVVLLDNLWKHPPVGLVSGGDIEDRDSLLSPTFYIARALENAAQITESSLGEILADPPAVIFIADVGIIAEEERPALESWLREGGVLIRFAGPVFSQASDDLLPVPIRLRDRALGGAMSWSSVQGVAPFEPASPFFGIETTRDALVDRQVLAEPSIDLAERTWARLDDGTPLVTAAQWGEGWLILVHTTANTQWTNLPLSGLFADMMRRLITLSEGKSAGLGDTPLGSILTLNGFGALAPPEGGTGFIVASQLHETTPGPATPPGLYGNADVRRAFNLGTAITEPQVLTLPEEVKTVGFEHNEEFDLRGILLGLAALILMIETYVSLALRGLAPIPWRAAGLALIPLVAAGLAFPSAVDADDDLRAAMSVHFAHVITGDDRVDSIARAGLSGLSRIVTERTSVEPGDPIGVDIETDDLALYPLVYWPITQSQPVPGTRGRANLDAFLAIGGVLVIDTRDADQQIEGMTNPGPNTARLPELLHGLNIPALLRVAQGHVLTQSYYLINNFPGRWNTGSLWAEQHPGGLNDGVSAILITSNDWASAWALNDRMRPIFPVVPGGERQREMAFRAGINLVMYAMTGNYKADSVHVSTILERLGQ